jgi:hypothetical protein
MRRFLSGSLLFVLACSSKDGSNAPATGSSPQDPFIPGGTAPPEGTTGPNGTNPPDGQPGEPEQPRVPYQHFDVNHVLSTGQSNSVAHEGRPVLSTSQPYSNVMFDVGIMTSGVCEREGCRVYQKPTKLVPLVDGDTFWYPVETMSSGLANETSKIAKEVYKLPKHDLLVSLAGRNGLTYWCLRRGGCNWLDQSYLNSFDESMRQVDDGMALSKAAGKSYVVRAVTAIHGESDDFAYATNTQEFPLDGSDGTFQSLKTYADALLEWQRDFETEVQKKTGQTIPVPLLFSQHSGWNDIATSAVAGYQYEAHVRSKGKAVLVTAGYPLSWHDDCRHYSNHGERQLGEYFAKVYGHIVLGGEHWEPVHPKSTTFADGVLTAKFHVPNPPLVFDTERVTNPGNYGFEVTDGAGAKLTISDIALAGPDTVTMKVSGKPAHLRYAMTAVPHTCPGPTQGARGNLRDSDTTPSQYGYSLFNWAVHFDVAVAQ